MPNEQNGYCGPQTSTTSANAGSRRSSKDGSMRYQRRPGEHLMRGPYAGPIPRVRTKQMDQAGIADQYDDCSPTVRQKRGITRLDTFRENAIETEPLNSNALIDFEKPEGSLPPNEESSRTLKIRSALSVLIPAAFQCVAAIAGFWPLTRNRKYYQLIHITFSSLAVLQWLPSVNAVAVEINENFVQMHEWYQESSYLINVILLCAAAFGAIILPSITLCVAATQLLPYSRQLKGDIVGVCLALGTALIAATVCCFSGYATSRSLTNAIQWKPSAVVANQSALYAFALKEVIIAGYVMLSSVFFFIAAIQRNQNVVIASAIVQIICVLALCQLFSPSRMTAVLINSRVLSIDNSTYPVAQVNVVLLYAFIIALLLMISIQFIVTVISLRSHSLSTGSAPTLEYPQQRTSF
ncbi:unnamed protein product [Cylicocyclus nassatus]|uniref:Uncharacterized protein n=1 Tax=Cylicocyclus nassatus TaxID=53992 RepID=A0AA36GY77_CYLNA|nr:unnamed protein product [Cylicocyclus nassatus]